MSVQGKCYAIVDKNGVEIYVGSTIQALSERFSKHKNWSKRYPERPIYKYIADNGGWEQFSIVLIEEYSCENKDELRKREGALIKSLRPVGNSRIAGRTQQEVLREWREKNRQYYNAYMREWRERKKTQKNAPVIN